MSEYSSTRYRLRLRSLEDVKQRLHMKEIDCDVRYPSCDERVSLLGNAISKNMEALAARVPMAYSGEPVVTNVIKATSLKNALQENELTFLKEATGRLLSSNDLKTLDSAEILLAKGDIASLSSLKGEVASALTNLNSAVKQAHNILVTTEKKVVSEVAIKTLAEMGYKAKTKEIQDDILIRGTRKDRSIAMRITDKNEFHMDMAGFTSTSCSEERELLHETLKKHDIECETIERCHHGKKEGGVLAQEAMRELPFLFNPLEKHAVKNNQRNTLLKLSVLKQKIKRQ